MLLVIEPGDVWERSIEAARSLIEQILVNLVDNSSKHAANATDTFTSVLT